MNNSRSFTLFIFAAVIFLRCLSWTGAATSCHPDDEAGLLAFKSGITRDPLGLLGSWKKGTDCCSWWGVYCPTGDRVNKLLLFGGYTYLGRGYLWGTISPSLAKLQHLEEVSLAYLKITGSFPQFLLHLPKLNEFRISDTRLSGPLPANIGSLSNVGVVTIDNNRFTGPIPTSISNLTRLTSLTLAGNRLSGTIPTSISNFTRLTSLTLAGNRLSGTIPNIFKSMAKLTVLDLSRNGFSGKLPPSIASLAPTLTYLDLSQNHLSGSPARFLNQAEVLIEFLASGNKLRFDLGKLNVTKLLTTLDLSMNLVFGEVPASVAGLQKLNLSQNHLCGKLPLTNFPASVFAGNDCLCGSPLSPCKA